MLSIKRKKSGDVHNFVFEPSNQEEIDQYQWSYSGKRGCHYAFRTIWHAKKKYQERIYLHHQLWEKVNGERKKGFIIDHKDGNTYNNLLINLRQIRQRGNVINQKMRSDNSSGIKGVTFENKSRNKRKWIAHWRETADEGESVQKQARYFTKEEAAARRLQEEEINDLYREFKRRE